MNSDHHLIAQGAAAAVAATLTNLQSDCIHELALQDQARVKAETAIDEIRTFIGTPHQILGNPNTKHGEIAEQIEIGFTNARCFLHHLACEARKDEHRTGAIDYWIDSTPIQSKFYNNLVTELASMEKHLNKYPDFIAKAGSYCLPKDHFETIEKLLRGGTIDNLNAKHVGAILKQIYGHHLIYENSNRTLL